MTIRIEHKNKVVKFYDVPASAANSIESLLNAIEVEKSDIISVESGVDIFIDDFCKKCDFWNTESQICMFGELDCDDPERRKCREILGSKGE